MEANRRDTEPTAVPVAVEGAYHAIDAISVRLTNKQTYEVCSSAGALHKSLREHHRVLLTF